VINVALGTSLFLIAAGAILAYAVEVDTEGVNLDTVGIILMVVGIIGFLLSALFWASWAPFGSDRRRTYVEDRDYADGGDVVVRRRL
jgi:hypothetical protein